MGPQKEKIVFVVCWRLKSVTQTHDVIWATPTNLRTYCNSILNYKPRVYRSFARKVLWLYLKVCWFSLRPVLHVCESISYILVSRFFVNCFAGLFLFSKSFLCLCLHARRISKSVGPFIVCAWLQTIICILPPSISSPFCLCFLVLEPSQCS